VQDLVEQYSYLTVVASKSRFAAQDQFVAGLTFLQAARYHLAVGALAALRTHVADALRSGRMAIEIAAFAARVKRQPELAMTWLNAGHDDASCDRYNRLFRGQKLFPDNDPLLSEMGKRFDSTSKLSHPSIYALAEHTRVVTTDTRLNIEFHYFTMTKDNPREPILSFFWTLDTHFGILRIFVDVLADVLATERQSVDVRMNSIDAKLGVRKVRWKDVILGTPASATPAPSGLIVIPPF
jgi:hypothetical protein